MPPAQTRLETLQICKLLQCVREEDREKIAKLTENGVPHLINYADPGGGDTALTAAAIANNMDMIEYLLSLGAHPNVCDSKGRTAVMRAAEYGHVQCVEKLAKAGADMQIMDEQGKGVIFYCLSSTQRHEACLDIVLAHDADVNNVNSEGVPVFLYACENAVENEKMCMSLLGKGADPTCRHEKHNRTAIMAACASGSASVARAILENGGDVSAVMVHQHTHAAHEAAKGGFLECLKVLSAYGASFDQVNLQGNTPIHLAAEKGHTMCCKFLSQRGCNPKPKNVEGNSAKVVAKEEGFKDAMKVCRKAEKSFGKTGKNNDPWILHLYDFCSVRSEQLLTEFSQMDDEKIGVLPRDVFLEILTGAGAPLPSDDDVKKILTLHDKLKDGTNVCYAEFLSGKKYVNKQYLHSAFGPKEKKRKGGGKGGRKKGKTKMPLPICTQNEGERATDGGPPRVFIDKHVHFTDVGRFDRDRPPLNPILDDSAWYLEKPDRSYMRLNEASKHRDMQSMKDALNNNQTDVDNRDKNFKTPLMISALNGNIDVMKLLCEKGANINTADNFKWTPLHFACHAGLADTVEYLLQQGANSDAVTLGGGTPFTKAIESSRPEIVQMLLERGVKVQTENRKGLSPMDIAVAWADPRVYDLVKKKWDAMPKPDKKKQKKKNAPSAKKRPESAKRAATGDQPPPSPERVRKGSILRAASALAIGVDERENIMYVPHKAWRPQPSTEELIAERVVRRERFGWEVDFPEFQMPFLQNVSNRVIKQGGFD